MQMHCLHLPAQSPSVICISASEIAVPSGSQISNSTVDAPCGPPLVQVDLEWVSRHGVALLLGMGPPLPLDEEVCCIDVRRADERTLYGCIPGAGQASSRRHGTLYVTVPVLALAA